jgi:hypothetical protein
LKPLDLGEDEGAFGLVCDKNNHDNFMPLSFENPEEIIALFNDLKNNSRR